MGQMPSSSAFVLLLTPKALVPDSFLSQGRTIKAFTDLENKPVVTSVEKERGKEHCWGGGW